MYADKMYIYKKKKMFKVAKCMQSILVKVHSNIDNQFIISEVIN